MGTILRIYLVLSAVVALLIIFNNTISLNDREIVLFLNYFYIFIYSVIFLLSILSLLDIRSRKLLNALMFIYSVEFLFSVLILILNFDDISEMGIFATEHFFVLTIIIYLIFYIKKLDNKQTKPLIVED